MHFQTEFPFLLPRGFIDPQGQLHREGRMRLATAFDELESAQDVRVQTNAAFLPILLLRRVIMQLGTVQLITPQLIGSLFVSDLAYLEELYERINTPELVMLDVVCPACSSQFPIQVAPIGVQAL